MESNFNKHHILNIGETTEGEQKRSIQDTTTARDLSTQTIQLYIN